MLPGEEVEELDELGRPRRPRSWWSGCCSTCASAAPASTWPSATRTGRRSCTAARRAAGAAPRPPTAPRRRYDPAVLGAALGGLLRTPAADRPHAHGRRRASRVAERLAVLRGLLRRGLVLVRRGGQDADRVTVVRDRLRAARALQARRGAWEQAEPFGEITVARRRRAAGGGAHDARWRATLEALLFLAPDPVAVEELADALQTSEEAVAAGARASSRPTSTAAGSCCAGSPAGWRSPRIRTPRRPRGGCSPARARPRSRPPRPRRWRSSPTCSPSPAPRWPASAAWRRSRRPPRCVERGLIEEAGRSQFGAVLYRTTPLFLKLFGLRLAGRAARRSRSGTRARRRPPTLRDRLLRAGEARARRPQRRAGTQAPRRARSPPATLSGSSRSPKAFRRAAELAASACADRRR